MNLSKGLARLLAIGTLALGLVLAVVSNTIPHSFADNYGKNGKVAICHATSSNSNPYVSESPNIANNGTLDGGHLNHTGGVYPTPKWGDIIPPYSYGDFSYTGMNWTNGGQDIWNNNCSIPKATPTPTDATTPTITDTLTPTITGDVTDAPRKTPTPTGGDNNVGEDPSPTQNVTAAPTTNVSSTPTPILTDVPTVAATSTSNSNSDGKSIVQSATGSSNSSSNTPIGVSATTMAQTGNFGSILSDISMFVGVVLSTYATKKKK